MRRIIIFIFVFVLLAGLTGGLGYFQFVLKPEIIRGVIGGMKPPASTVAVAIAQADKWTPKIAAIGTFRAVQGIDIAPQVGGVVRAIRFESGQKAAQGAALLDIDDSIEQADLKSNNATLKNADLALDRQRALAAGGNTAKSNLDAAQATRDTAAASVERSKAVIAQKAIVAPFAGRLGIRKVDLGQYLTPGASIVSLQTLDPIFVDFSVPEQFLDRLKTGQTVELAVDAFPSRTFTAKIRTIDARVSADTRALLVRAEAPNKDERLLPGMFANVAVLAGDAQPVVTVPRTAVSYSLYGDSIDVVTPRPAQPGEAQAAAPAADAYVIERRFVHSGEARGDIVAIMDGVRAGERGVTEGQIKLAPGASVVISNAPGLAPLTPRPKE